MSPPVNCPPAPRPTPSNIPGCPGPRVAITVKELITLCHDLLNIFLTLGYVLVFEDRNNVLLIFLTPTDTTL